EFWEGELVHRRREKTPITVASRWALQRDRAGRPIAILEINTDISARRRAEEALHESRRQLAHAQALAHLGSWERDIPSDVVTCSDEMSRVYGLTPGQVAVSYEGFLERVHPDDRERVRRVIEYALRDARPFEFEHRVVLPDGAVRSLLARGEVICDAAGRPI